MLRIRCRSQDLIAFDGSSPDSILYIFHHRLKEAMPSFSEVFNPLQDGIFRLAL